MSETAGQAQITGTTALLGIVGDPIAQVRSPEIFNALLAEAGRDAVLLPIQIPVEGFETAVRGLFAIKNLHGLVFTYPHKARVVPLLDRVLDVAGEIGAVNAVRREADGSWTGEMFDGFGLISAMSRLGRVPTGARILLMGAGGAGSAIAVALAKQGARALTLYDIDEKRASDLAARIRKFAPDCDVRAGAAIAAGHDVVINATPVGMAPGDGMAAEIGPLDPGIAVIDIVPKPEVTPLMTYARQAGCPTIGGRAMVEGQAAAMLAFFRQIDAPGSHAAPLGAAAELAGVS